MKGFFRWFQSGTKMKRWMFLIVLGMITACYGMAKLLTGNELGLFTDLPIIILSFVAGFIFVIIGIVHMQKRTLELFVQEADDRIDDNNSKIKSLIYNKKIYHQGPKIVAIGGGTGLNSVLKGLKNYTDNITAIVTVSDYGEEITDSRKLLQTLPLEDIKESLVALSNEEVAMGQLLNHEFKKGKLEELSFGDIYLLAMKEMYGDFAQSIEKTTDILNITGKVLPVTLEPMTICAELEDGTVIENKDKIPEIVNSKTSKISRIFIKPTTCKPAPGVLEAIQEADAIIIGPGSLYTNVIPNLLVKGVSKAIRESKAFKVYVSNIMTESGQTDNYTLADHIKAIQEHAGKGVVEYCIYDTGELIPEYIRKYNMQGQELVEIDTAKAKAEGIYLMQRDISHITGDHIRHNPDAIAASIVQLICDDLKFKDMQNDTKYVLLNDRLQDAKKSLKETSKENREAIEKRKNNQKKGDSKFFRKYKERIESIQEAEIKLKVKQGLPIEEYTANTKKADSEPLHTKTEKQTNKKEGNNKQNKKKQNSKNNEQGKHAGKQNKKQDKVEKEPKKAPQVNQLEEEEKKKFIEAINKLRK